MDKVGSKDFFGSSWYKLSKTLPILKNFLKKKIHLFDEKNLENRKSFNTPHQNAI